MPPPKTKSKRVLLSVDPESYTLLQAAAKAAGYKSLAAYVYDAAAGRVLAETGKQMRELRRGAPGKVKRR